MKRKILIALILSLSIATANCAFAAEVFDAPQNTTTETEELQTNIIVNEEVVEDTVQVKDQEKNKKTFFKRNKKEKAKKQKKQEAEQQEPKEEVIVDSSVIEYFPERSEFEAIGNAKVTIPSQGSVLNADKIVYNHDRNNVKAYGNIVLTKDNQNVYGDFIQIDLNENNAMISRPVLENIAIKIKAKNAIVTEEKTEAFDGFVTINQKTNYKFISRPVFGFHDPMMDDVIPKNFYFKEKYDNKWRLKAKTIVIDARKTRDVATLKNADIYIKDTKLASAGNMKLYTDKEQKYMESNLSSGHALLK